MSEAKHAIYVSPARADSAECGYLGIDGVMTLRNTPYLVTRHPPLVRTFDTPAEASAEIRRRGWRECFGVVAATTTAYVCLAPLPSPRPSWR